MVRPLNNDALNDLPNCVSGPAYNRSSLTAGILHVGVGNFHRAHMAVYLDRLFAKGKGHSWALTGAGVRPGDARMRNLLMAQDWLTTVVELDPAGLTGKVIGSMIDFVEIDPELTAARMCNPDIKIVSLTITEGGYYVDALTGGFDAGHADMVADIADPAKPTSVFGIIIKALRIRRDAGIAPFTVMSCDNLPENGHVAKQAVISLARLIDPDLAIWIEANVAFPSTMVDCITPATTDRERDLVRDEFGLIDAAPVVCEPFRQWVLEDNFPQGRPPLELVGAEFVEDVAPYELMKLRILNGGHAAIAYPSALLGHHFVHDAMADPIIKDWLLTLEQRALIPSLSPIEGVSYDTYLANVVERFSNSAVGDTIARLCFDGSNRQPKFIFPAAAEALAAGRDVSGFALEVALWCRYCAGTDDDGREIAPADENAADLKRRALASKTDPMEFLSNAAVLGDLGGQAVFQKHFAGWIARIWANGTRATLTHWIDA